MINFDVCSDLHLEFEWYFNDHFDTMPDPKLYQQWFITPKSKYLIIAGDLGVWSEDNKRSQQLIQHFHDWVSDQYDKVFFVLGNHDWWNHQLNGSTIDRFQQLLPRFIILDQFRNPSYQIDDNVVLWGSTMWTHVTNHYVVWRSMNDYRMIKDNSGQSITCDMTNAINDCSFKNLCSFVEQNKDKKIVVITHHAPCKGEHVNPDCIVEAYFNQYQSWIESQINVVGWVHGHYHGLADYMIGNTHVISNPRGYVDLQWIANCFELEQLTVD